MHQNFVCYPLSTETFYYQDRFNLLDSQADLSTIGGRIKYYRLQSGLRQKDLSQITGIDRGTIIDYENNFVPHTLEICTRIAEGLKIDHFLIFDDYLTFLASDFASKILSIRKNLKLTQKGFAKLLGVVQSTVSAWEQNEKYPSRVNFKRIKKYI